MGKVDRYSIYEIIWDEIQVGLQKSKLCDDDGAEDIETIMAEAQVASKAAKRIMDKFVELVLDEKEKE